MTHRGLFQLPLNRHGFGNMQDGAAGPYGLANPARLFELMPQNEREADLRGQLAAARNDVRKKNLMIEEMDHRTKNAIQMAASLLQLQSIKASDETKGALQSAINRLISMAEVHRMLYAEDSPDAIDFSRYISRLGEGLIGTQQNAAADIDLLIDAVDATWKPDVVISLGLIVNEALTNALKHAFPSGRKGSIRLGLARSGDLMQLRISDDGVGMAKEPPRGSIGLKLIDVLAAQVKGSATIAPALPCGTVVTVTFPDPDVRRHNNLR